jgi:hypothetical protein
LINLQLLAKCLIEGGLALQEHDDALHSYVFHASFAGEPWPLAVVESDVKVCHGLFAQKLNSSFVDVELRLLENEGQFYRLLVAAAYADVAFDLG